MARAVLIRSLKCTTQFEATKVFPMIRLTTLTLMSALAAAPVLALPGLGGGNSTGGARETGSVGYSGGEGGDETATPRTPRQSGPRYRVVSGQPGPSNQGTPAHVWSQWADEICGGDSLIWYDPDENGDPENGTVEYECLDDT